MVEPSREAITQGELLPVADTSLGRSQPNEAHGSETQLTLRGSARSRVLVAFDPSVIEDLAVDHGLISAALELTIDGSARGWGSKGRQVELHRVTQSWTEDATWNCSHDEDLGNHRPDCSGEAAWDLGSLGAGDTLLDSETIVNNQTGVVAFDVTADVQALIDGAVDHNGWVLLRAGDHSGGVLDVGSRESATPPRLLLELEEEAADITPPSWPAGSELTATDVTTDSLTLTWTAATDDTAVTSYKVFQDDVEIATVAGDVLTLNVMGLSPETSYTFKVEAGDAAGNWSTDGPSTTVTTATPPDVTPPSWPAGSELVASNIGMTSLNLSWTAAIDDREVVHYLVSQDGLGIAVTDGSTLTLDVAGLTAETEYTFAVEASDAAGNQSSDGPTVTVTTAQPPDTSPPTWPAGGELTASDIAETSLTLHWPAAEDDRGVTGYRLVQDGVEIAIVDGAVLSHGVTGLEAESEYSFGVEATDAAGNWSTGWPTATVLTALDLPPDPAEIAPPLDPTVPTNLYDASTFLYLGSDPVQIDADPTVFVPERTAVLRGQVLDVDGLPLPGVYVTVLGGSAYGYTRSREDGWYDLVVNGGGMVVLQYELGGYLTVQRHPETVWMDSTVVDDVVMTLLDEEVTTVDLFAPGDFQFAQGSEVIDDDGPRQATVLFPAGTTAMMEFSDGSELPIDMLSVRATEYTVGETGPDAMPAELPPMTAYTYCVELSVDEAIEAGATGVSFSQPLPFYLDNFIGFDAGVPVPVGRYDREIGGWIPLENGVVLDIVSITTGMTDLDIDGDGLADDATVLAELGITDAERAELANLYDVGHSLWRAMIDHFSPYDLNLGAECAGESDIGCAAPDIDVPPQQTENPGMQCGSIIDCHNQVLGEQVGITGTGMSLRYSSNRTTGYRRPYNITVRITGDVVSPDLLGIIVAIQVGGRVYRTFFDEVSITPNMLYTETNWNGRDMAGRLLQGPQDAQIAVGYIYPVRYSASGRFGAGGGMGVIQQVRWYGIENTGTRWAFSSTRVGGFTNEETGLGGWELDVHHTYDLLARRLYLGDGRVRSTRPSSTVIETVAGRADCISSEGDHCGDGGPAIEADLGFSDIVFAVGPDGSIFVKDSDPDRIRRIDPDGIITLYAGGGTCRMDSLECEGVPATDVNIDPRGRPMVGPDGSLYFVNYGGLNNYSLSRIDPDGTFHTVVPESESGVRADGDVWDGAGLGRPANMEIGPDGSLYYAQAYRSAIRRLSPDGWLTTIASETVSETSFGNLRSMTFDHDGSILYVSDRNVMRLTLDRRIERIASFPQLYSPGVITVSTDGSIYVSESRYANIYRVENDGALTLIAGGGPSGFSEDGTPAAGAAFAHIVGNAVVAPNGNLLFRTEDLSRRQVIRQITPAFPGYGMDDYLIASEDGSQVYHFDNQGRHLRTVHGLTGEMIYEFEYNERGHLESIVHGEVEDLTANRTTIDRDIDGTPLSITSRFGQVTVFEYGETGYLERITNPAGESVLMHYSEHPSFRGLLLAFAEDSTVSDPYLSPRARLFSYDLEGLLRVHDEPDGGQRTLTRTELETDGTRVGGFEVAVETVLGRTTTYRRELFQNGEEIRRTISPDGLMTELSIGKDGSRMLTYPDGTEVVQQRGPDPRYGMMSPILEEVSVTTPGGRTTTVTSEQTLELDEGFDPFSPGTQTRTVSQNGRDSVTTYVYDPLSATPRTINSTTPLGRTSTVEIDDFGRPLVAQQADLAPVSMAYDDQSRLEILTEGEGAEARQTIMEYDDVSGGWLATVTDPLDRTWSFDRDLAGRVEAATRPDGEAIGMSYDDFGRLQSVTPPGRDAHIFSYTDMDQVEGYRPPIVPGYPADAVTNSYDEDHRPSQTELADGSVLSFDYDPTTHRLESITSPLGVTALTYDAAGRVDTIAAPDGEGLAFTYDGFLPESVTWAGSVSGTIGFEYDADLRVSEMTIAGTPISYAYNDDDQIVSAGALTLTRNATTGFLEGTSLESVATSLAYDDFGQLASEDVIYNATDTLYSASYEPDALGRITSVDETVEADAVLREYTYDLAGRLESVYEDGVEVGSFEYDANGNRLTFDTLIDGAACTAAYDEQDRLTSCSADGFHSVSFDWDDNGSLETRVDAAGTTTYDYDVFGALRSVEISDGTFIEYAIDPAGRRIGRTHFDTDGTTVLDERRWIYGDALNPVAELDGAGAVTAVFVYGSRGHVPDYMIAGGETYRIVSDVRGSVRLVVNAATGAVVQRLDYDAWGRVTSESGDPMFQPFGYAGGLRDPETGLTRFGARDYDPTTGRWTARDPILFDGGETGLYLYVGNDPVTWIDPSGELPIAAIVIAGIFIVYTGLTVESHDDSLDFASAFLGWGIGSLFTKSPKLASTGERAIRTAVGGADECVSTASRVNPNTLNHIFGQSRHGLDDLVSSFGSRESAYNALKRATQAEADYGLISDVFETVVRVGGQDVTVRGRVIDGVVRIGTAFIR